MSPDQAPARRPRVIVVGGGFGGLSTALGLRRAPVDVVLIAQRNHHLFQPLLYQVATAALSPAEIAAPIRSIVGNQPHVTVLLGKVTAVDAAERIVHVRDTSVTLIPYDFLVVATGARHSYFGHDDWAAHAPGLKTIEDATEIRRKVLLAFERAENELDPEERARLMTFVVVGAGPTGVEMAGSIADLAHTMLASDFRLIDTGKARVVLVEGGKHVLGTFPEDLQSYTRRSLERLGVEVRLGQPVTDVGADGVTVGEERIGTRTIVWAAGVRASEAAEWFGADAAKSGQVRVTERLTLPGRPEVFVIGDTAEVRDRDGRHVPHLAPAAKQQGAYVARAIRLALDGKQPEAFRYKDWGSLATIGRKSAVIQFGRIHLTGLVAWLLWGAAHIFFLIGFRNRVFVMLDWVSSYLLYRGGARLITGVKRE